MRDPREVPEQMTEGVTEVLKKGLGMLGQGVNSIANVLQSVDSSVRSLDGSLTGQPRPNPAGQQPQGVVANQVVNLVRQGRDAASQTSNPQAPGAVNGFRQAMGLLFQTDIPEVSQLGDMLPSPTEVVQMGLKDLRGSTALARLANGLGTMDDVAQVAQFSEDLLSRVQTTLVREPPAPVPAKKAPRPRRKKAVSETDTSDSAPPPAAATPPKKKREPRKKKEAATLAQKPPPEGDIALAQAVSEVMDDDLVTGWFKEFEQGAIPEGEWVGRFSAYAHKRGLDGIDDIMERANTRLGDVIARRASARA